MSSNTNRKEFQEYMKDCKTFKDLSTRLLEFTSQNKCGITCNNNWGIPFEDIEIFEGKKKSYIKCRFYLDGGRTYKLVKGFIKKVYPTDFEYKTGIQYYKEE